MASAWQHPAQPMWTNPERYGSSSTPAQPTYLSAPAPTVREDILNVQADGRLAAHLRETPAPHILEEDAEPNEDLAGNDFTYSQDTTTAFQELLKLIDSNTRELPSVLSAKHYAALTQLPLTYRMPPVSENKRASQAKRVGRQQTRESASNKRASQPATNARVRPKKTIRESPARKRPKEAEHPPENDQKRQSTLLTQRASARWPVGPLARCPFSWVLYSVESGTRILEDPEPGFFG